ncbi:MAG TPA: tetratricopeptide repeat protein [Candidatus Xenobia bacterium]
MLAPLVVLAAVAWPAHHQAAQEAGGGSLVPYRYPLVGVSRTTSEIAFYEKRVKADPTDAADEAILARLYLHQARMTMDPAYFMLAEQMAQASMSHQPFNNDNAEMIVARVDEAKHDFRGALQICQKVAREKTQEDEVLVEGTCNLGLGKVAEAQAAVDRLVGMASNLSTWSMEALVREDRGVDPQEAWHKAFSLEEAGDMYGSAWSRTLYGRWYFRHGHYAEAEGLYREALRVFPQFPLTLQQLAELDTVTGHYDEAETCYAQAYAVAPQATYLTGKARVRQLRGDSTGAAQLQASAEAILRRDLKSSPLGHGRDLACLLLTRGGPGDVAEAVAIMTKDIQNRRDWLTLDACAWALQAAGRYAEAEKVEQEALAGGIHSAQLRWRLAELKKAQGQAGADDEAEALRDNPDFKRAHAAVPFML